MINSAHDGGGDPSAAENSGVTLDRGFDPLDPEPEGSTHCWRSSSNGTSARPAFKLRRPSSTALPNSTKGFSMPLRLNVGLQQKKGLPHYGSLGAACHLELELEASLLERDPEEFHKQVAAAFAICRDAVAEELAACE